MWEGLLRFNFQRSQYNVAFGGVLDCILEGFGFPLGTRFARQIFCIVFWVYELEPDFVSILGPKFNGFLFFSFILLECLLHVLRFG